VRRRRCQSALGRLEVLDEAASSLPWSERLARLQPGEAFTAWLVSELTARVAAIVRSRSGTRFDRISTTPRRAIGSPRWSAEDASLRAPRPGIALLVDPDRVAGRLVAEIQRVIAVQERKDTRRLAARRAIVPSVGRQRSFWFPGAMGSSWRWSSRDRGRDGFPLDMMGNSGRDARRRRVLVRHPRYRDAALPVPTYGTCRTRSA